MIVTRKHFACCAGIEALGLRHRDRHGVNVGGRSGWGPVSEEDQRHRDRRGSEDPASQPSRGTERPSTTAAKAPTAARKQTIAAPVGKS